ncbi:unnamed protein product, partial [Prorocentrum cordatum]
MGDAAGIGALLEQLGLDSLDLQEVFNPGEFAKGAPKFDLKPGVAMDLRTGWDFWLEEQRKRLMELLKASGKRDEVKFQRLLAECKVFLGFCMELAAYQHSRGKWFLFEHPWTASSWKEECIKGIRELPGVIVVRGSQCVFGAKSYWPDGSEGLVAKPTGWMTHSREVAKQVGIVCDGSHEHVHLLERRAKAAERYPLGLVKAILKGIRNELKIGKGIHAFEVGQTAEEPEILDQATEEEMATFYDGIGGAVLDPVGVKNARMDEMGYMSRLGVFERRKISEALQVTGTKPLPSGWVDTNKGDDQKPELRSRLVAKETRKLSTLGPKDAAATFAATPPLEGLRMILSMAMTGRHGDRVLTFIDISRAHLHSELQRPVYLKAPAEDLECKDDECWLLLKAMYGLRDAGSSFDLKVEDIMVRILKSKQG